MPSFGSLNAAGALAKLAGAAGNYAGELPTVTVSGAQGKLANTRSPEMLTAAPGDAALLPLEETKAMGSNVAFIQSVANFIH